MASTAFQCTVNVAGFVESSDEEVALASFTFGPPSLAVAPVPMEHAVLLLIFLAPDVVNVTIMRDTPLTEALLIDKMYGFLYTS